MNLKSNIITTRSCAGFFIAVSLVFSASAYAHGGFDHVQGTVVTATDKAVTVKTAKGNVDVKLDAKTELTKGKEKAQVTDLIPGVRVVVDIPEDSKDKIAHSVKIGVAAKAAPEHEHADHH